MKQMVGGMRGFNGRLDVVKGLSIEFFAHWKIVAHSAGRENVTVAVEWWMQRN
jgi:hypothetical protein